MKSNTNKKNSKSNGKTKNNSKNQTKNNRSGIVILIIGLVLLFLAVFFLFVFPQLNKQEDNNIGNGNQGSQNYLTSLNTPLHFQAHVTVKVDGQTYTPKDADIIGADSFTINDDSSVDYQINDGINGCRDITIQIEGMDQPLILRTFITNEKSHIIMNLNAEVDSNTKKAVVTGELTADEFSESLETWSIYRELDMTASAEDMDKIGGTF